GVRGLTAREPVCQSAEAVSSPPMKRPTLALAIACALSLAACAEPPPPAASPPTPSPASPAPAPAKESTVARMRAQARAVAPLVKSALVKELLAAADDLPAQATRRLWHDPRKTRFYTEHDLARLSE